MIFEFSCYIINSWQFFNYIITSVNGHDEQQAHVGTNVAERSVLNVDFGIKRRVKRRPKFYASGKHAVVAVVDVDGVACEQCHQRYAGENESFHFV